MIERTRGEKGRGEGRGGEEKRYGQQHLPILPDTFLSPCFPHLSSRFLSRFTCCRHRLRGWSRLPWSPGTGCEESAACRSDAAIPQQAAAALRPSEEDEETCWRTEPTARSSPEA
eukprot:718860-Hanusia_phi.AAC.2